MAGDGGAARPVVLKVRDLNAWYGESHILQGIDLDLREGEVVTLLGRNGAGKTTTIKSIMGVIEKRRGSVSLNGDELIRLDARSIARKGIAWCPEERGIFPSLDVEENLILPAVVAPGGFTLDQIYALFPNLKARRNSQGNQLSGGEQQMVAIGRILQTGSRLLLLDEPTEGLAPVIVQQIAQLLVRLKEMGFTIVLVEQNVRASWAVADRHYVVEQGKIIDQIANDELEANRALLNKYLGV